MHFTQKRNLLPIALIFNLTSSLATCEIWYTFEMKFDFSYFGDHWYSWNLCREM